MAKFKNKKGGICEVYSLDNIKKLRENKDYIEITEKTKKIVISNNSASENKNSVENNK